MLMEKKKETRDVLFSALHSNLLFVSCPLSYNGCYDGKSSAPFHDVGSQRQRLMVVVWQ